MARPMLRGAAAIWPPRAFSVAADICSGSKGLLSVRRISCCGLSPRSDSCHPASNAGFPRRLQLQELAAAGSWQQRLVRPSPSLACCGEQRRFVARVRVHRFAGVVPLKIKAPKSEWYLQAEKEFLSEREQSSKGRDRKLLQAANEVPDGYIERWREEDLSKLDPSLRDTLSLRCASNSQLHKWRKLQLCRQLQRRPFDTGSSAVQIACLTEKILNARQHLLRHRGDHTKKRILSIWLARRHRVMKYLYRTDYDLYKLTCNLLREPLRKSLLSSLPPSSLLAEDQLLAKAAHEKAVEPKKAISPVAVDGDRCKFLIRQRLWKGRYRPRPVKLPDGKVVRFTRHIMEQPPPGWNSITRYFASLWILGSSAGRLKTLFDREMTVAERNSPCDDALDAVNKKYKRLLDDLLASAPAVPHETKPRISRAWPYGVKEERVRGKYTIPNPTGAGVGYCPVPLFF